MCEAEGEPIPEITWKRAVDGITFSEGDKVMATQCRVVSNIIVFSVFGILLNLTLDSNLPSNFRNPINVLIFKKVVYYKVSLKINSKEKKVEG